jgi:hypothetical protein
MACAPGSVTTCKDDESRTGGGPRSVAEIDLKTLLKSLPEPQLPAGLEDRVRAFLQGRRGYVAH